VLEVSRQTVGMYQNRYLLRVRSILDFRVENLMEGRLVGHRMDVFSGPRLRRLGRGWLAGESGTRQSMRCNSVINTHTLDNQRLLTLTSECMVCLLNMSIPNSAPVSVNLINPSRVMT